MAILAVVVFVFLIIALGMVGLKNAVTPSGRFRCAVTPTKPAADTPKVNPRYAVLVHALRNEGYFGERRSNDADLVIVDSAFLAGLIEDLDRTTDLSWSAPLLRLRLRPTTDSFGGELKDKYNWLLLTPTHAIGFNRQTKES